MINYSNSDSLSHKIHMLILINEIVIFNIIFHGVFMVGESLAGFCSLYKVLYFNPSNDKLGMFPFMTFLMTQSINVHLRVTKYILLHKPLTPHFLFYLSHKFE